MDTFSEITVDDVQQRADAWLNALRGEGGDLQTLCVESGVEIVGFDFDTVPGLVTAIGDSPVKRISTRWAIVEGGPVAIMALKTGGPDSIDITAKVGLRGTFKIVRTAAEPASEARMPASVAANGDD